MTFSLCLIWLGGPGAQPGGGQPFDVNLFAPDGSLLQVLETGSQTVPEPGALLLLLSGIAYARCLPRVTR